MSLLGLGNPYTYGRFVSKSIHFNDLFFPSCEFFFIFALGYGGPSCTTFGDGLH